MAGRVLGSMLLPSRDASIDKRDCNFPTPGTFYRTMFRFACLSLLLASCLPAAEIHSDLFQNLRLVYQDNFDSGPLNTEFWEVRQGSTWTIVDGILRGSPAPKEYQEKKIAAGDKAHAGLKPVIWLKQVPENFVCAMRLRYDAEAYHSKFPLLDLGHHIHTLVFGEKATTLTIKKDAATAEFTEPLFKLNTWHDVVLELKKGSLIVTIDGKSRRYDSPHVDMTGQAQIDFKGIDLGSCQIDHLRLWEGR